MRIKATVYLEAAPWMVWEKLRRSDTLVYITQGVTEFANARAFPKFWEEGAVIRTPVTLLGLFHNPDYRFTFVRIDENNLTMRTKEAGGAIKEWIHLMQIRPSGDGGSYYTDVVDIKAGLMTPVVWALMSYVYRYRQRRWQKLIDQF